MYKPIDIPSGLLNRMRAEGGIIKPLGAGQFKFQKTPTSISGALSQEDIPLSERLSIANRMRFEKEKVKELKDWEA